jgi:hypothetical protein
LTSEPLSPPPLPSRPPRSLLVHWAVDSAVALLALLVLGLILGASIYLIVGIAVVVGAAAAPSSRRAEMRALAAREQDRAAPEQDGQANE